MKTLIVPANVGPCQVDDFPDDCERSREGALHLRPARTLNVTDDEYLHLAEHHAELLSKMIEVEPGRSLAERVRPEHLVAPKASSSVPAAKPLSLAERTRAHQARAKKETAGLSGEALRKKLAELSAAAPALEAEKRAALVDSATAHMRDEKLEDPDDANED